MSERLSCQAVGAGSVVARYVAGTLPEPDTAAFEEHLLTCAGCQRDVQLAVAIREAIPDSQGAAARSRWPRWLGPSVITLAAAAVLAGVIVVSRDRVPDAVVRLGDVAQPPVYLGVAVRQNPTQGDSLFGVAMAAYAVGDFARAAADLPRALAAGADTVPVQFFAGASLLMSEHLEDAAEAFRTVIRGGDTPYLAESHYYLAKALLRLGRVAEARRELAAAAGSSSEIADAAGALDDSIAAAIGP